MSQTSHKSPDAGDYLDKVLRQFERDKATLQVVEDQDRRRQALGAIAKQSAELQRYLGAAGVTGAAPRETKAVIRAAQSVPGPGNVAPTGEPLTAVLTLIIALTALKRKLRRGKAV